MHMHFGQDVQRLLESESRLIQRPARLPSIRPAIRLLEFFDPARNPAQQGLQVVQGQLSHKESYLLAPGRGCSIPDPRRNFNLSGPAGRRPGALAEGRSPKGRVCAARRTRAQLCTTLHNSLTWGCTTCTKDD